MEIYTNLHFRLLAEEDRVFISIFDFDYKLPEFAEVVKEVPRLQVTYFGNLRKAFIEQNRELVEIGMLKPQIELTISKNWMQGSVRLNMTELELEREQRHIAVQIKELLAAKGVTHGILDEVIEQGLQVQTEVVVAKGTDPVDGEDAKIRYFQLSERVPSIRQNGSVDHYELSFIDEVQTGDWLGEKLQPAAGESGCNLRGEAVLPKKGKDKPLLYDKHTVEESLEDGKTVLRAKLAGVVQTKSNKISVLEILTIHGDVGPRTGNIKYDGIVKVTGTVLDGYSVHAVKDISILSGMGIGMVDRIVSETGDVFIKGGVFGRGRAHIEAGGKVFVKHANDCTIKSGDSIHIGLYSIGSRLSSKYINLDRTRGKIIGGHVHADVQVIAGYIGNEMERETTIQINGFDRSKLKNELEEVLRKYQKTLEEFSELNKEAAMDDDEQAEESVERWLKWEGVYLRIKELEEQRRMLAANLNAKGEGEISIVQKAFPRTLLQIKELERRIEKITSGSYYFKENQIFIENHNLIT